MRSHNHDVITLPQDVTVLLQLSRYNGELQLWAPFVFEKQLCKLVVSFSPYDTRRFDLASFEKTRQTLHPVRRIGNVFFCRLDNERVEPIVPADEYRDGDGEALRDFRERFKKFAHA